MNSEQWKTALKATIMFAAGVIGGVGVAQGWYSAAGLTAFLNGPIFGALVTAVVTGTLSVVARSKFNLLVSSAAVNPETTFVAPSAVANATPNSPNIVPPGSVEAKQAAKVSP